MCKNLLILISIPMILLGGCTSMQVDEKILTSHVSTPEDGVVTMVVPTQKDLELKALYKEALHQKNELRSFNLPIQQNGLYVVANSVLRHNIITLKGSQYQIVSASPSRNLVRLRRYENSIWANNTSGDPFHIEALPAVAGIPYLIYQGSEERKNPLGAGTLQRNGKEMSVAYIGPDNKEWFGKGWDITTTKNGLVFENDMIYTKNDEPATLGNIENRVLSCSSYDKGRVILASPDMDNFDQMFTILPKNKFRVLGIRYFADRNEVQNAIYDDDMPKKLEDDVVILDDFSRYNPSNNNGYGEECTAKIRKQSEIRVEKTYINDTYQEVPVDMVFDKHIRQYSRYDAVKGMTFNTLSNSEFPLPVISHETLRYTPKDLHTTKSKYKSNSNFVIRDLNGILYLLISPRTEATIEYTYSVYRVELPYLVFLTPENSSSDEVVYAFGIWKGYIYTEQDSDKHTFRKKSIDPDPDDDDDDEIIFEMTNSDLIRDGYREPKNSLRSRTTEHKRIHL